MHSPGPAKCPQSPVGQPNVAVCVQDRLAPCHRMEVHKISQDDADSSGALSSEKLRTIKKVNLCESKQQG